MNKDEALAQIRTDLSLQLGRNFSFRQAYLDNKFRALTAEPRPSFFQFEQNSFWMSVFSSINWLAHYKFRKDRVSDREIVKWLSDVFEWPPDIAEAFWKCGRHPIAHTGARNFFYSEIVKTSDGSTKRMYIDLNLSEPQAWDTENAYHALPISMAGDAFRPASTLPGQQVLFFYPPLPAILTRLVNNILEDVQNADFTQLKSYQKVYRALPFLQDDGETARMDNYLDIYPRLQN